MRKGKPRPNRRQGTVARWTPERRSNFEREILARRKTIAQIAKEYDVSQNTVGNHKKRILMPAIVAAQQQADIDERKEAQAYLRWLYEEGRDSIRRVKYGKIVVDQQTGMPKVDPETGEEVRILEDPRRHGTVSQLITAARAVVEKIGEATGEFKNVGNDDTPKIIRVITIPKIGEQAIVQTGNVRELAPIAEEEDAEDDESA